MLKNNADWAVGMDPPATLTMFSGGLLLSCAARFPHVTCNFDQSVRIEPNRGQGG